MSPGDSAAVSTNNRQGRLPAAARGTANCCGWPPECSMIITGRAAGSSSPLRAQHASEAVVRCCSNRSACRRCRTSSRPAACPGSAAVPVRNAAPAARLADWRRKAISALAEPQHLGVPLHQPPVEPTDGVVLAVGVVVAALRAQHLVARRAIIGTPWLNSSEANMFLAWRLRRRTTARRRVGPSTRSWRCSCCCRHRGCFRRWRGCASARSSPGR